MSKVRKIIFQTPNSLEFRVIFWEVYPAVSPESPPLYRCSLSLSLPPSLPPSPSQRFSIYRCCLYVWLFWAGSWGTSMDWKEHPPQRNVLSPNSSGFPCSSTEKIISIIHVQLQTLDLNLYFLFMCYNII